MAAESLYRKSRGIRSHLDVYWNNSSAHFFWSAIIGVNPFRFTVYSAQNNRHTSFFTGRVPFEGLPMCCNFKHSFTPSTVWVVLKLQLGDEELNICCTWWFYSSFWMAFLPLKNDMLWPVKDTDMQQDNARRKTADSSERCRAEALDWVITQSNLNKQKTCK